MSSDSHVASVAPPARPLTRRFVLFGSAAAIVGTALSFVSSAEAATIHSATDLEAYQKALALLAPTYRFALIDIRADWCAVCHRLERDVLSHPSVRQHLERTALVKVDVTAMDEGNRQLLSHLRANGPPTFFIVDTATGQEYNGTRSVGSFSRRDLVRRLQPFNQAR